MHIPDGFLSPEVAVATGAGGAAAVALALRAAERTLDDRRIPLLGVTGAFVFAAQMLNFPVAGGTSGHFLGGALAAVLLGPWLGALVMTVVVGSQALLFADGGLTALGANVLNMAVVGCATAALVLAAGRRLAPGPAAAPALAGAAAWAATMAAALAASAELAASGTVPFATVGPAMLAVHAVIGAGEALITAAAVGALAASRPDLVGARPAAQGA